MKLSRPSIRARSAIGCYVLMLVACLCGAASHAATFNLFSPATGILKGMSTSYITTSASYADIVGLFSSCPGSGAEALLDNGTCGVLASGSVTSVDFTAPSVFSVTGNPITSSGTIALAFATGQTQNQVLASPNGSSGAVALRSLVAADVPALGANPTGTIGLTAVNGSATTYLRSDGAPALSQAITPTWTGVHNFAAAGGSAVLVTGAAATINRAFSLEGTTTAAHYLRAVNTGGGLFLGVNNSAGNALITGGSAYGTVLTSTTATDLSLATNTAERVRIAAAGNVTINAPSSGTALNVTAATGTAYAAIFNGTARGVAVRAGASSSEYSLIVSNAGATVDHLLVNGVGAIAVNNGSYGTAGQVLTSGGSAAAPSWATPGTGLTSARAVATSGASNGGNLGAHSAGFASFTSSGVGSIQLALTTSFFSSAPACVATVDGGGNINAIVSSISTTSMSINTYNAATGLGADATVNIICML